uniref:FMRFamide receptor n=1 Tax=Aceria tosichella TaxID=561515 RepID=A0A6G1SD84_9ACAR
MPDESQLGPITQEQASLNGLLDPSYAQFRDQTRFWIQRVAVPLIMVVGLFGNLVTIIIMTRRRMRSTTNMYLAALALVDMLYLVLTFLLGLSHYPNMVGRGYYLYWQLRPFLMMLTDACSNTSVWLTVTFTIERFIAVKYPMKGKVWCTEARAKRLIVFVFLFGILFASPVPFEWEVVERPAKRDQAKQLESVNITNMGSEKSRVDLGLSSGLGDSYGGGSDGDDDDSQDEESQNTRLPTSDGKQIEDSSSNDEEQKQQQKQHQRQQQQLPDSRDEPDEMAYILSLENTDFGRNETYKTIYYWSTAVIFYFIPLLSLTFFNGFLILSVHRSFRERKRMTTGQQTLARSQNQFHHNHHQQHTNHLLPSPRDARAKKQESVVNYKKNNRLAIPKIEIASKQQRARKLDASHTATDRNGNEMVVVGVKTNSRRISWDGSACVETEAKDQAANTCSVQSKRPESDTCQHGLISRSDLGVPSTDKIGQAGQNKPNGRNVIDHQHEINRTSTTTGGGTTGAEISSLRVQADRRVEFNCDADNDGDGTLDVQTNCDKRNYSNGTNGRQPPDGLNYSLEKESKPTIVVPTVRMCHEAPVTTTTTTTNNNTSSNNSTNPAPSEITKCRKINQLADDDSSSLKQETDLDAQIDNTPVLTTTTSDSQPGLQHSREFVVSDLLTRETPALSSSQTNNKTANNKSSNNSHDHHAVASVESGSYISGKFHLINATSVGGSGGLTPNSNYDSGSCTTIQTTASLVPASTQERRITIMLIAVVILFLCCQIPSAAMLLYTSVREPIPNTNEHALVLAFGNIFNFLMAVNAAGNFILYSFLSKKYRKTFMILFCNCFKRRNKPEVSDERLRAGVGGCLSTSSVVGQATNDEHLVKMNGGGGGTGTRLGRWTNSQIVRSKFKSARQSTLQSDDFANYLVGGNFVKRQRRDTLV